MSLATGMSRSPEDGRFAVMDALAHIRQSIMDIVTTPVGTRVMRPEYGSRVPRLIDNPVTKGWKLEIYTAIAEALHRWEPRVRVEQVGIDAVGSGYVELTIRYTLLADGTQDTASITVVKAS